MAVPSIVHFPSTWGASPAAGEGFVYSSHSGTFDDGGTTKTYITLPFPASVSAGQLAIAFLFCANSTHDIREKDTTLFTPMADTSVYTGQGLYSRWFYRICDGSEGGTTVNFVADAYTGTTLRYGMIFTLTDHDPTTPIEDYDYTYGIDPSAPYNNCVSPITTTTVNDCRVFRIYHLSNDASGSAVPDSVGVGENGTRHFNRGTSAGNDGTVTIDSYSVASAGDFAATERSAVQANNETWLSIAFAIRPADAGSTKVLSRGMSTMNGGMIDLT